MTAIEFWYEFASTYSYPAAMRAGEAAKEKGVAVQWRPFLLGPVFAELGWTTSPFNLQPAKGAYMWRDLERTCQRLDLPFRRPDPFPQHSVAAARIATALTDDGADGARARFSRAVYRAEFGDGLAISDQNVLAGLLEAESLDPFTVTAQANAPETKQALRASTDEARALGIFGAPTFRTPDGELFWGNDRLDEATDWVLEHVA